jgi:hypothetical protein
VIKVKKATKEKKEKLVMLEAVEGRETKGIKETQALMVHKEKKEKQVGLHAYATLIF